MGPDDRRRTKALAALPPASGLNFRGRGSQITATPIENRTLMATS